MLRRVVRWVVIGGSAAVQVALPVVAVAQTATVAPPPAKTVQAKATQPKTVPPITTHSVQAMPAQAPSGPSALVVETPPPLAVNTLPMPAPEQLLGLIRSTIIALNQANQTGNYTVLRDLGAPDFRNGNDASRLGAIFQVLRDQAVDLGPLLHISTEVSQAPAMDGNGLLRLVGFFPTEPLRVNFDLSFQLFENRWRPYTLSVYLARLEARVETPVLKPAAASVKK